MPELLVTSFAATVIAWTVIPLLRHEVWWIRIFDFPRVQICVLTVLATASYATVAGWETPLDLAILLALLACTAYQVACIARYTPLAATELKATTTPDPDRSVSMLVANVLMPNRNATGLLDIIRAFDPDIVLTLETDDWWESALEGLETRYPHTVKHALDNLYGMHLYSRLPLEEPRLEFLVDEAVPSIHTAVVLPHGHRTALHCLHPAPPSPTEETTSTKRDAELLLVAKALDRENPSVIVAGDLNDVAWSSTTRLFQRLSGLLDPRVGRGLFNTFHAKYRILRWPLDHVFCSADFTVTRVARCAPFGSDHFPIYVELCHTPSAELLQGQDSPDEQDRDRAREKIDLVDTAGEVPRPVAESAPESRSRSD